MSSFFGAVAGFSLSSFTKIFGSKQGWKNTLKLIDCPQDILPLLIPHRIAILHVATVFDRNLALLLWRRTIRHRSHVLSDHVGLLNLWPRRLVPVANGSEDHDDDQNYGNHYGSNDDVDQVGSSYLTTTASNAAQRLRRR